MRRAKGGVMTVLHEGRLNIRRSEESRYGLLDCWRDDEMELLLAEQL